MSKKQGVSIQYGKGAARSRGRLGGRPLFLNENQVKKMIKMYYDGSVGIDNICDCFGISKPTLYKYLKEWKGRE